VGPPFILIGLGTEHSRNVNSRCTERGDVALVEFFVGNESVVDAVAEVENCLDIVSHKQRELFKSRRFCFSN